MMGCLFDSPAALRLALALCSLCVMGVDACGPGGTTLLAAYNVHANHLGSVELMTDDTSSGAAQRASFEPFGTRESQSPTLPSGFPAHAFAGHELDQESGLYYARARYYDPAVGRFVSPDPALNDGGVSFHRAATQPQAANAYSYVENQPTVAIDPDGRASQRWWDNLLGPLRRLRGRSLEDLQNFRRGVATSSLSRNGFAFVNHRDHVVMSHAGDFETAARAFHRRQFPDQDASRFANGVYSLGELNLLPQVHRAVQDWVNETRDIVQQAFPNALLDPSVHVGFGRATPGRHVDEGLGFLGSLTLRGESTVLFPFSDRPGTTQPSGMTTIWTGELGSSSAGVPPTVHSSPLGSSRRLTLFVDFAVD